MNTTWNHVTFYVLEGNNLIRQCTECGQGLHTQSQGRACHKQNNSLIATTEFNKYYFSRFERFWRWILF